MLSISIVYFLNFVVSYAVIKAFRRNAFMCLSKFFFFFFQMIILQCLNGSLSFLPVLRHILGTLLFLDLLGVWDMTPDVVCVFYL